MYLHHIFASKCFDLITRIYIGTYSQDISLVIVVIKDIQRDKHIIYGHDEQMDMSYWTNLANNFFENMQIFLEHDHICQNILLLDEHEPYQMDSQT